MGTAKLKKKDANEKIQPFLRHYGPALLGLLMLVLVVHDIFGSTLSGHAPHAAGNQKSKPPALIS